MTDKAELRTELKKKRAAISMIERAELSARVAVRALTLPEYAKASTVLCYASLPDEVMTGALIRVILESGRTLALPAVRDGEMHAMRLTMPEAVHRGAFHVMEPDGSEEIEPEKFDILLVPGVSFDPEGNRLGYGGGYFDRYLKKCRGMKVGMCYSVQMTDRLPTEEHDVRMDAVVTEKETYRRGGNI